MCRHAKIGSCQLVQHSQYILICVDFGLNIFYLTHFLVRVCLRAYNRGCTKYSTLYFCIVYVRGVNRAEISGPARKIIFSARPAINVL